MVSRADQGSGGRYRRSSTKPYNAKIPGKQLTGFFDSSHLISSILLLDFYAKAKLRITLRISQPNSYGLGLGFLDNGLKDSNTSLTVISEHDATVGHTTSNQILSIVNRGADSD